MNKIDITKKYRTVSGNKAEILKTGVANFYWSVAALISDENGIQYLMTYQDDGRVRSDGHPDRNDLVENSPYEDFKIDEPVMVRDFDTEPWNRRHLQALMRMAAQKHGMLDRQVGPLIMSETMQLGTNVVDQHQKNWQAPLKHKLIR